MSDQPHTLAHLGWLGIVRLGLVQTALGSIVVLTTSTLNRVMMVELALPAALPAALVAWHYAVQLSRPRWGHGSDGGARRTPWIIGGMGVLALGGILAADATALMSGSPVVGILLAILAFTMIGAGVGASGTSLLALLATRVTPTRRPAAAAITWIMMVMGIAATAGIAGGQLDPFSMQRLAMVSGAVSLGAFLLTLAAVAGVERTAAVVTEPAEPKTDFRVALRETLADPQARRFTLFVLISMIAYSAQDLILEPFAGLVFGMTPGQSTQMSGMQHGGVLLGMILVGAAGGFVGARGQGWMRGWTLAGCGGSALSLAALVVAAQVGPGWPIAPTVFALGFFNGVFAVAAIGSMMALAGQGRGANGGRREGIRMGVWGAAQAVGFGTGGFFGAVAVDIGRRLFGEDATAFGLVFALEATLFIVSAVIAVRIGAPAATSQPQPIGARHVQA
ncbi:BCD family MFS transporter [Brevundimonas subvibrioides]|uniref:PUCC protein n=1 Tax=Brevundimonas subvibrioides (strain ATCC 15264 / DSM 4735 / LMG 14903 / NBRC 16000 / CB 81) TaxID=633149 RepID=D9QPA2_BRESC|nr:BCD family MFS transporter [Brevundimonas subvibrioides]ADL02365.1 PUCC protein [Brevundimonas subvibrioides ATCC 15264]